MTRTTDQEGKTSIAINLNPEKYQIKITYNGNTQYSKTETTKTITVLSTITGNNITKIYKNNTQYTAKFTNGQGKPLKNTMVEFNIYGIFYKRTTDENGTAKININLNPDTYIITAKNPINNQTYSNTIKVLSSITGKNITKYYKNNTQYYATFLNKDGKPLKNTTVEFNIYGVFYKRITDENGTAKLNINLRPGEYIITAINPVNNQMHSNKIKVLPKLIGNYQIGRASCRERV
mgnify:CR=1 FL=1